jgi:hypothetical protein
MPAVRLSPIATAAALLVLAAAVVAVGRRATN